MAGSARAQEIAEKLRVFDDPKFIFEPVEHVYTYEGKVITGATTYLKRFSEEFDSAYWSDKNAAKEKCTPEELLARWDLKRDRACTLGTMVHESIEQYWRDKDDAVLQLDDADESMMADAEDRVALFREFAGRRMGAMEPVVLEQRLFNVGWGIAGTMDALFIVGGQLLVGDWKTNGKFKTNKDYAFKKMFAPFAHLKDNEFNKYSIQLSLYRLMLQEAGIETDGAFLCHVPKGGPVAVHKCTDLTGIMRNHLDGRNTNMFEPQPLF